MIEPKRSARAQESLRLAPPAPMIARMISEEVTLDGIKLPPGVECMFPAWKLHKDPRCVRWSHAAAANDNGAVQRSMRQRVLLSSPLVRRRRRQYSRS